MPFTLPITIKDELDDDTIIEASAQLDIESGEISEVRRSSYDILAEGIPATRKNYMFTCGVLAKDGKELEFGVEAGKDGTYCVNATELEELKEKAANLFSGKGSKKPAQKA